MRIFITLCCLAITLLTGCSSRYADNGNITQVTLSASEQRTVTRNMADILFHNFGAKAVFDFSYSPQNQFAATFASELRAKGFGVNEQNTQARYNTALHYQVIALNPQQFYVRILAGEQVFTRIWSTQNNVLAPLTDITHNKGGA